MAAALAVAGVTACGSDKAEGPAPFESDGPRGADDELASDEYGSSDEGDEGMEPSGSNELPTAPCTVGFDKQILPKIREIWRCGASACHSGVGAHAPLMDTTDGDKTYALLTSYVRGGKKLVDTKSTDPTKSALYCLVQGNCAEPTVDSKGGSLRMPYQGISDSDLSMVKSWLECGGSR